MNKHVILNFTYIYKYYHNHLIITLLAGMFLILLNIAVISFLVGASCVILCGDVNMLLFIISTNENKNGYWLLGVHNL